MDDTDWLPLSFAQQRLWFLEQLFSRTPTYNLANVVRLRGPLDAKALEASLDGIVRRHESLRTTFNAVAGEPQQVIASECELDLKRVDLAHLPARVRARRATRL